MAGAGHDRLDGQSGADAMRGGAGDDVYVVDDAGDRVLERAGDGIDTVLASVGYRLGGGVEHLRLIGTGAIDGTGNGLDNSLTGNAGANRLDGRGGADRMAGGAGDDVYVVGSAGDTVIERAGDGIDTVESAVSFLLGRQEVETLRLTGTDAINGTGNDLANALHGNAASNRLNGGAGDDALHGGRGIDTLVGGTGSDSFWFAAYGAANADRIIDFDAAADTICLDQTRFAALAEGALAETAFQAGPTAHDADDRILYDAATGKLFYDADGSGSGAAFLFAQVAAGTALTHAHFEVGI